MKNIKFFVVAILFATLAIGGFSSAQAIEEPQTVLQATFNPADTVMTVDGDSLWKYSNLEYDQLIAMNPEYNLVKVVRGPGDVYVKLPVGIWIKGVKRVLASSLVPTPTPTPSLSPSPSPSPTPENVATTWSLPFDLASILLFLTALALLAALGVIAYLVFVVWFNRNRRGAANAGPRCEQSGINDRTAAAAFQRQYRGEGEGSQNDFTVENLRRRLASGAITTFFRNGTSGTYVLDREAVYIADLRYPDGKVKYNEMLLSGCGNPLRRSGNVLSYLPGLNFHFVDTNPRYIPVVSEGSAGASSSQTSIDFTNGKAVIMTDGGTVEMETDNDTQFSNLDSKEENQLPAVQVRQNGVEFVVRNGVITGVKAMPPDVVTTMIGIMYGGRENPEQEVPTAESMTEQADGEETSETQPASS